MSDLIKITENISYLPATLEPGEYPPLSCDIVFIKTSRGTWIYDTGNCQKAADLINQVEGKKFVVISHFHPDHINNLNKITYDELYVSNETFKRTKKGTIVSQNLTFHEEPEIQIIQLPSSHAKGCLCILCGEYCFTGDGTYCKEVVGNHTYNAQLLKEEIDTLQALPCKYLCLDHDRNFIQNKDIVIRLHKNIYSRKKDNNPTISVEDYFNPDGSVKQV